jgi:AraC-like DNA-binding protein
MLSVETGISSRYISAAINGYLRKNFFDLVNEMRIEEAKKNLLSLDDNYTVESIAGKCGFRSRSAFFAAFKKV